jgi:hypothetical protein
MQIKGLGLAGMMAMVALVGCGSSDGIGGTGGAGGSTGKGGGAGGVGSGKGGSTGSGGGFTTSVPSGTKLTGLTTAQATQFCSDVGSYFDSTFLPMLCHASAPLSGLEAAYLDLLENSSASNSELQAACTGAAADAGSCSDLEDGGTQSCDVSSEPATCQATVGDFTKCLDDTTAADLQYYASLPSCSTLTAANVTAFFQADGGSSLNPPEPTSCSMFDSTCDVDNMVMSNMSLRMRLKRRR